MIEESVTATSADMDTGEDISFRAWRAEDGSYLLRDGERDIETYDAHGGPLSIEGVFSTPDGSGYRFDWRDDTWHTEDGTQIPASSVPSDREFVGLWLSSDAILGRIDAVTSATPEFADSRSASTYERLQLVYDFYAQELGRIGYDGEGGGTVLVVNDNRLGASNAYSTSVSSIDGASLGVEDMNMAVVSVGEDNSRSVDTVAHEFTHSVERSVSGMVSSGESGALKEATSDIMGEVAQDYRDNGILDGSMDWVHGGRNLETPALSTAFERGNSEPSAHPSAYHDANWGDVSDPLDNGYVHNNSTVISHAAFLMCEGDGLPGESLTAEELARLVYITFHSLTPDCTFAQYRELFELNASNMVGQGLLSSEGKLARISAAFDRVNVRDSEGAAAAEAFLGVIDDLIDQHGSPRIYRGGAGDGQHTYASGVCFARLVDFGDGEERLVVGFSERAAYGDFEIWEYDERSGKGEMVFSGDVSVSYGTGDAFFILTRSGDGRPLIESSNNEYIGLTDSGEMGVVHEFSSTYDESTKGFHYYHNGVEIDAERWDEMWDALLSNRTQTFVINDFLTSSSLAEVVVGVEDTVATVDAVRSELEGRI